MVIIIIIIMNTSPRKLIQEPQMRSCSSHLSNKNVLSNFRNESKLKDGSCYVFVMVMYLLWLCICYGYEFVIVMNLL